MKQTHLLLLLPFALIGFACERHSASSLPSHGEHASEHGTAATGAKGHDAPHAEAKAAKPEQPAGQPAGKAPQFFEQKPAK
ncbi:MAG: hypothetical protein RLZZ244_1418 [Verrucomicrobiota bacterium]|jgi:hypothetical protein